MAHDQAGWERAEREQAGPGAAARAEKTVTFAVAADGRVTAEITGADTYTEEPKITVTRQGDTAAALTEKDITGTRTEEVPRPDGGTPFERKVKTIGTRPLAPGRYTVTVVCTGKEYSDDVTVPAVGGVTAPLRFIGPAKPPV